MNRKTIALSAIALVTLSALLGVVTMTALAETNSTSTDTTTATTAPTTTDTTMAPPDGGMQMMDQGGMGSHGGRGHGMDMMGGMGGVEISQEYNATVTAILENDTDTANLLAQGYSVTSIHPNIKTVVGGDGTVTAKATTANVILTNGTTGFARVNVDIENYKVTYIETITRTVIDKSSS
jgi:hypothetical protein